LRSAAGAEAGAAWAKAAIVVALNDAEKAPNEAEVGAAAAVTG